MTANLRTLPQFDEYFNLISQTEVPEEAFKPEEALSITIEGRLVSKTQWSPLNKFGTHSSKNLVIELLIHGDLPFSSWKVTTVGPAAHAAQKSLSNGDRISLIGTRKTTRATKWKCNHIITINGGPTHREMILRHYGSFKAYEDYKKGIVHKTAYRELTAQAVHLGLI